ncbi:AAA family ATPase [Streptomyces sp. NPDC056785]|uniref:AAA family ATPase n=1 Tax=Streptomyces sp. NPDC056785 TaxID=3345944 RepID=UPI0036C1B7DE
MTFTFAPATRETAKARIGIQGPGGAGKTKTALRMAEALAQGGLIGLVDTERRSALKYAPVPGRPDIEAHEFEHLPMAFCSPENLIAAVNAAIEARVAVLIIDSWSAFWAGKGGLLARVDEESKKAGNYGGKFTAWGPVNELEQEMLDALLNFPGHVIVTMRTKNDYAMEGKNVTKVGVKTIQREGAEYEVDVVIDMIAGTGTVTKTRYSALDGACVHHPGEAFAEAILEQLGQGIDPVQVIVDELVADGLTYERVRELYKQAHGRNLLGSGLLHPRTGEPTKLVDVIGEYGQAVKPAPDAPSTPSAPPTGQGQDAPPATPSDEGQDPAQEPVSPPQMRMMHACFTKVGLGHKDLREQRLRATALIVGRPLSSANELTKGEAQTLLDTLTNYGERENAAADFEVMVTGLEDAARAMAEQDARQAALQPTG